MPADSSTTSAIDDIVSELIRPNSPGVAVGIIRDGEPVYTRAFGLANVEHSVPNTTSTVFDIGSITKQFTSFAILMLLRDGKLSLDDDVRKFVPDLPEYDPPVRVRHCLYHTCGLTDWVFALELTGPVEDYVLEKRAYRTITSLSDTIFPAGQQHSYTNTGYILLAWIVRHVSGRTLHQFLREHVFEPLSMSRSGFLPGSENFMPGQAQGYWRDHKGIVYRTSGLSEVYGDGMMHSSIEDMVRWLQNLNSRTVGDSELFDLFFAPGQLDDGHELRYAAGWELDRYRGLQAIRHGGMSVGFQSHIAWFPEVRVGVAILGNVRPFLPWPMANKVLDMLIGERAPALESTTQRTASDECVSEEPDDITGSYFTATGLPVFVDWVPDKLRIDIWLWRRPFTRQFVDVFKEPDSEDTVTFHRNPDGNVTHFTMETADNACPRMHSPIQTAVKFDGISLQQPDLDQYQGRYISDELETVYTIATECGGLRAKHMRCYDWHLRPIKSCLTGTFEDDFAQEGNWPGKVTFERSSDGKIEGFRVRGSHVNVRFGKLSPTLEQSALQ